MSTKLNQAQTIIALSLMVFLMILTRGHSSSSIIHLPDFTLPALFIAGVYLRHWLAPTTLIITAVAIDNYAIVHQGISAHCITPGYSVLPLSYLLMYFGGRYLDSLVVNSLKPLLKITIVLFITSSIQWLIATLSYYTFTTKAWIEFPAYALRWAPIEIAYVFSWMAVVVVVFALNQRYKLVRYFTQGTYG